MLYLPGTKIILINKKKKLYYINNPSGSSPENIIKGDFAIGISSFNNYKFRNRDLIFQKL